MTTARQMVEEFNARHPDRAIAGPWKGSKEALRRRMDETEREVQATEAERRDADANRAAPEPEAEAKGARGAIGRAVEELLLTSGADYAEIVRQVRGRFPGARTTARSVASVACGMRKKGVPVATRRAKA
jgi:hypothetical protein